MGDSVAHAASPHNPPHVVLIGGSGRSGTNITKALLARHPQVAALPFEYRFIIDPDGIIDFYRSYTATWSPFLADRRLKRLQNLLETLAEEPALHAWAGDVIRRFNRDGKQLSPRAYHGWQLADHLPNYRHHVAQLMDALIAFRFNACWTGAESYQPQLQITHGEPRSRAELAPILRRFLYAVIGDYLAQTGKQCFVEDNTWNILFARELVELMPRAKLLHIYRDPRDVVASFRQQRWCPTDVEQAALWYRSIMTHWFAVRSELPEEFYCEIALEELVRAPETTVRTLCECSGLPFASQLLDIDLSRAHSGRWQRDFSPAEQEIVQIILAEILRELGYP